MIFLLIKCYFEIIYEFIEVYEVFFFYIFK